MARWTYTSRTPSGHRVLTSEVFPTQEVAFSSARNARDRNLGTEILFFQEEETGESPTLEDWYAWCRDHPSCRKRFENASLK